MLHHRHCSAGACFLHKLFAVNKPIKCFLQLTVWQFSICNKMSLSKIAPQDRFDDMTDEILAVKHVQVQKKNTKYNKFAEKQLWDYLLVKGFQQLNWIII